MSTPTHSDASLAYLDLCDAIKRLRRPDGTALGSTPPHFPQNELRLLDVASHNAVHQAIVASHP